MAKGVTLSLFVFLALTVGVGHSADVADEELIEQIAKLEQILDEQQLQLNSLEAKAKRRRLENRPSIYGPDSGNTTRAFLESEQMTAALTHMWLVLCGVLALFMQAGLVMLKMGHCRMKNAESIFLNHMTDVLFGTLCWWAFGFTFAYDLESYNDEGNKKNNFAGGFGSAFGLGFLKMYDDGRQFDPVYDRPYNNGRFYNGQPQSTGVTPMLVWFFRWTFCSLAATIASSGIAERANQHSYMLYSICSSSFIFPIVAAWTWGRGWIAGSDGDAVFIDFAGSGIVHMVGGVGALIGAIMVGKRDGRFNEDSAGNRMREVPQQFDPHSVPLVILGTFTCWVGAYGLHCGSTMAMNSIEKGFLAAQVAMNTTISAAMGGITAFILKFALTRKYDICFFCNGILGGIVAIAAGCSNVECGTALGIGIASGFIYFGISTFLKIMRVDDPIDAFAVHGACGMWGVVAAGVFDWGNGFNHVHAFEGFRCILNYDTLDDQGRPLCKENMGAGLFGMNVVLILAGAAWVAVFAIIIYGLLRLCGCLRYREEILAKAIDDWKFRPPHAYALELKEVELKEDYI